MMKGIAVSGPVNVIFFLLFLKDNTKKITFLLSFLGSSEKDNSDVNF